MCFTNVQMNQRYGANDDLSRLNQQAVFRQVRNQKFAYFTVSERTPHESGKKISLKGQRHVT